MARYRKHRVEHDDTINSIAQKYSNNPNLWIDIVEYNNLKYPYIVYSVEEKLQNPEHWVTLGDTLIIPIEQDLLDTDVNMLGTTDTDTLSAITLGSDLNMTADSRLIQQRGNEDEIFKLSANGRGDISTVKGVDNVKQAVIARLLTRRGSLLLHPNYGSDIHKILGSKAHSLTKDQLDNEIARTIKTDGRVVNVVRNHSLIDGHTYQGDFTVSINTLEEAFRLLIESGEEGLVIR